MLGVNRKVSSEVVAPIGDRGEDGVKDEVDRYRDCVGCILDASP